MRYGTGQPVRRAEDPRFLTGRGRYVDDLVLPRMAHAVVLRAPHGHARIAAIDTRAAEAAPGVLAVLSGADYAAEGLGDFPCLSLPDDQLAVPAVRVPAPALALDRVRYVGAPVVFVVAETLDQARDAAERVVIDYEALPAIASIAQAESACAVALWDAAPDNVCFTLENGDRARTEAALADAHHVTRLSLRNNRITAMPMEPRAAIGEYNAADDRYVLHLSCQNPHRVRQMLGQTVLKVPESRIQVIARDVGGGFGMKGGLYPEDVLVLWASRRIDRPVKWIAERTEALLGDSAGRDQDVSGEMAFDAQGRILGFRVRSDYNLGAHLSQGAGVSPADSAELYSAVYAMPTISVTTRAFFTNTAWTAPYRGAGRPEAAFLVERMLDQAARELGIDAVALRRRNFVPAAAMPYQSALAHCYDSGEFEALMDDALALADWPGFADRRAEAAARGVLRGRGMACYLESASMQNERMEIRFDGSGAVAIVAGTFSHGQGHETVYPQLVSDWLGVDFETIALIQGDTEKVSYGRGTFGSRSMTAGGSALRIAADRIIARGKTVAAHLLEAAVEDIAFADGVFAVAGTDRSIRITDLARASYAAYGFPAELGIGLEAVGDFAAGAGNFPNGCQIAEVEIDAETGAVALVSLAVVDDVGVVLNPLLLAGQIHGGIAQGAGQALVEDVVYEPQTAQLLSASLMDYCLPRADDLPSFVMGMHAVPSATNPLGVKGAGESGTVGAAPAVIGAILDALAPLGVTDIAMPATPQRVWQAIQQAAETR